VAVSFRLEGRVTYAYPQDGRVVLRDLELVLPAGQTTVVLGGSGVGKTTLLNLLALLWDRRLGQGSITYESPRTGAVWNYDRMKPAERAWLRGREFGVVPQTGHFLPGFTCEQNLIIPLALNGMARKPARERVRLLLELASDKDGTGRDLLDTLGKYPAGISTGQRQRLAVLRAVIHDPAVLFADEPVSNLDASNKRLMLDLFRSWRGNDLKLPPLPGQPSAAGSRSLVLICHEMETALEMGDWFLLLAPSASADEPAGATAKLIDREGFRKRFQD